ncbi:hypothetical protein [Streptomyces sp. NPDC057939]
MDKPAYDPDLPAEPTQTHTTAQAITNWLVPTLLLLEIIGHATAILDSWH